MLFGLSCKKESEELTPKTKAKSILEIAKENPELSIFVEALKKTGLDTLLNQPGTYTIFAPKNSVFGDKFSVGNTSKETLTKLLSNHVIGAINLASSFKTGYIKTFSEGPGRNKVSMYISLDANPGFVTLNGKSKVIPADIIASNGVIHYVDGVISVPTIFDHAKANPEAFKSLVSYLTRPSQKAVLKLIDTVATSANPYTLFAPTNAAFDLATGDNGFAKGASDAQITELLRYHVVKSNVISSSLTDKQSITTDLNQKIAVALDITGIKIKDQANRINTIDLKDVQASNGVIHVVSTVFQPKFIAR